MDEFFLQLSELVRAGWSFEVTPEPNEPTVPATRAVILWSYERAGKDQPLEVAAVFPLIDWINLFAPEIELRKVVAKMHARIFPLPPFGNISV
jgi:hypothetical protein